MVDEKTTLLITCKWLLVYFIVLVEAMTVYNLEIIISFVLLLLHEIFKYLGFALTNNHLTVYSFGMI